MKKILITITAALLLLTDSCDGSKNDGCIYDKTTVGATCIAIIPASDGESSEIFFTVRTKSGGIDTLTFSKQFGDPAYAEDLNELDIHAGDSLKCEHGILKSGNCDAETFTLTRDKY